MGTGREEIGSGEEGGKDRKVHPFKVT